MDKSLVRTQESAGTITQSCSVNKVFWKIVQNPQENNCARVSF